MKNIFITGITGQDGIFLVSKILKLDNKVRIFGSTRNSNETLFYKKLNALNTPKHKDIKLLNIDLEDFNSVNKLISDIEPAQIYNLTGPSSVIKSVNDNMATHTSIINIFDNLINSLKKNNISTDFFQASSSEMFSINETGKFNEESELDPLTPYAEAKMINHHKVLDLSNDHGWKIRSGIMFNHESEFRAKEYLLMQIIHSAKKISENNSNEFQIGSLDLIRDWSFAGDIVDGIYKINNAAKSNSYVIGSGIGTPIRKLVDIVFKYFELDYKEFLVINEELTRKNNQRKIVADNRKIKSELNWTTSLTIEELVIRCIKKLDNL